MTRSLNKLVNENFFSSVNSQNHLWFSYCLIKKEFTIIRSFLFILITALSLSAENKLTLDDCFKAAIQRSTTLIDQQELVIQMEERYKQAWGEMFPSVVLSDSLYINGAFKKGTGSTKENTLRLALDQPIFQGFKSIALIEQNKQLLSAQKEAREWALFQLYLDTAQIYYVLFSLQKEIEHLNNQIAIYDRRVNELIDWVNIGRAQSSDLISVKASRSLTKAQTLQTASQLSNAQTLFAFITGLERTTSITDNFNVPENIPSLSECLLTTERRNDLSVAKIRSLATQKGIKIAKSSYWPWVDLSVGILPPIDSTQKYLSWDAQITVSFAIFSGRVTASKVTEAESVSRQADNAYNALVYTIRKDVETAYRTLTGDITQKKAIAEAVSFAEANYNEMEKSYKRGIVKITDVLLSLSSYEDAKRTLDSLNYTIKFDVIKLKVLSGQLVLPQGSK